MPVGCGESATLPKTPTNEPDASSSHPGEWRGVTATTKPITLLAHELVTSLEGRRSEYGPVDESAKATADVWTVCLRRKLKEPITPHEAMIMMAVLKLAVRECYAPKQDNRVDGIGYVKLADDVTVSPPASVLQRQKEQPPCK